MALVLKDRVYETTNTTGTGTLTLEGAVTGYQSFSTIGNGNTTYYCISDGTNWEVGIGTYNSTGSTLARTTVLESSNSGNLVSFTSGTKDVICTYPAEKAVSTPDIENILKSSDIGVSVQAYSANLTEYASVNPTTAGLALLDDADAAAQRTTLGLGTAATTNSTAYATAAQGALADTALQPSYVENAYLITYTDLGVLPTTITLDIAKKWNIGEFTGSDTNYTINAISPTVSTLEPAHFTFVNNGSATKFVTFNSAILSIAGSIINQVTVPIGHKIDFDIRRNPLNGAVSYEAKVGDVNFNQTASGLATTWNPSDAAAAIVLSNSNKSVTRTGSGGANYSGVRGFGGEVNGKFRFALRCDAILVSGSGGSTTSIVQIGIASAGVSLSQTLGMVVSTAHQLLTYTSSANVTLGAFYGVLVDLNANLAWGTVNGSPISGNPEAGTGGVAITPDTFMYPCVFMKTATSGGSAGLFTLVDEVEDPFFNVWPSFANQWKV
jgi:hypothetical protein